MKVYALATFLGLIIGLAFANSCLTKDYIFVISGDNIYKCNERSGEVCFAVEKGRIWNEKLHMTQHEIIQNQRSKWWWQRLN
jgi:hypothetical protein